MFRRRNLYLSLVADEEIGGMTGMMLFALSDEFKELNIGVALDEGLAREDEGMTVFYGERHKMWTNVRSSFVCSQYFKQKLTSG